MTVCACACSVAELLFPEFLIALSTAGSLLFELGAAQEAAAARVLEEYERSIAAMRADLEAAAKARREQEAELAAQQASAKKGKPGARTPSPAVSPPPTDAVCDPLRPLV